MKTKFLVLTVLILVLVSACQSESDDAFVEDSLLKEIPMPEPIYMDLEINDYFLLKNDLSKSGENLQPSLYMAEYITAENSGEMGNTVFFNQRGNKQLNADFPVDPWYLDLIDGTNDITYYVDNNRPTSDMSVSASNAAIDRAMTTWDEISCSNLGITERPYDPVINTGVVAGFRGFGPFVDPINGWVADVVHAGWLPPEFFETLTPGGGNFILGVTFTFITGLDEDNNGKPDVWFREIYYNDRFAWNNGSSIDVETVALHEAGHGLSQGHFGKAFGTNANLKIHFAPRAVMNASYSGNQTEIGKTDNGGHCSIWGDWPNN